jgi:hypothetical protein
MKTIQDIVNDSGYPLQLRLEEIISTTKNSHDWRVLAKEHRWVNLNTNEEGFIDLILEHKTRNWRLVVESKRVAEASWNFLLPNEAHQLVSQLRILRADFTYKQALWLKDDLPPKSYESAFCVPEIQKAKDNRTLEKIAGDLLLSLESLASEEISIIQKMHQTPNRFSDDKMFYIPVIVTTSKLRVCIFNPSDVNIEDGKIKSSDIEEIKYIRFCKNLATNVNYIKPEILHLRDANKENDRTVFIVQATDFLEFIKALDSN